MPIEYCIASWFLVLKRPYIAIFRAHILGSQHKKYNAYLDKY